VKLDKWIKKFIIKEHSFYKMLKFQTIKSQHKREPQLMQLQAILKPLEMLNPLKKLKVENIKEITTE